MKEQDMGEAGVNWFTGLPLGAWLMIAAVLLAVGMVFLAFALAAMSSDSDYRVRGWENRPKHTEDDEWWAREYPLAEQVEWEDGHG